MSSPEYPCLAYQDGNENICTSCDTANNFYLWIINSTHTICAWYESYYTFYGYAACYPADWFYPTYHPDDSNYFWDFYYTYWDWIYFYTSDTGVGFCANNQMYFAGSDVDTLYCDGYPYISEAMDYTLNSIFVKAKYIYCYTCDYDGLYTQVVNYYDHIGIYIAECSNATTLCTYT